MCMCPDENFQKLKEQKDKRVHLLVDSRPTLSHEDVSIRHSLIVRGCLFVIQLYRQYLSPLKPPSCRFTPTCSQYALDAYTHFGFLLGTWRTFTRLLRCHPWHSGGHDPVIKNEKKPTQKTK